MNNQSPVEPSVNLFIRTLNFPFVMSEVLGIPRALQDPDSAPDDRCATLVHELNHLHAFMSPLGVLNTALALRLKDLHDEAATFNNTWLDLVTNGDLTDHEKSVEVVDRISAAADYAMTIQTLVEYTRPLLEGLAICAEMEMTIEAQNDTAAVVGALEWWHAYYLSLLQDPARLPSIQSPAYTERMLDEFEKQLEESRKISRLISGERILFEEHRDGDGKFAAAPYFLGYLFIKSLLQEWGARVPHLSRADLFGIANTCICVVLPMTLLYPYFVEEESAAEIRAPSLSEETIVAAIASFSSLGPSELERIRDGGLLAIDLRTKRLINLSAMDNPEDVLMKSLLAAIFPELNEDKARDTADMLWQSERAKFFHRTYTTRSIVLGVDPTNKLALLADLETMKRRNEGFEVPSMMWFPFKDDEEYKRFISRCESDEAKIPRVGLQSGKEFRIPSPKTVIAANLSAYVIFYPAGIGRGIEANRFKSPLEIVWRFGPDQGLAEDMFLTKSTSVHDNEVCILWQSLNSRLLKAFNEASDSSFRRYSDALQGPDGLGGPVNLYRGILAKLFEISAERAFLTATQKDESGRLIAEVMNQERENGDEETAEERLGNYCLRIISTGERCMKRNNAGQFKAMQSRCRAFYVNELFPRCDQSELLASRKFDFLDEHVLSEDFKHLRTWLLYGAALDQKGCYAVDEHNAASMATTVARVSSVCSNVLGVPLVRYQPDSRSITLDLLKT
jgi:hypothetical protein